MQNLYHSIDEFMLFGSNMEIVEKTKSLLQQRFDIKDMGLVV